MYTCLATQYLKTRDLIPFVPMFCKADVRHEKRTFHNNIGTIHITIAVEQITSQTSKTHGVWIGHIIAFFIRMQSEFSFSNVCFVIMVIAQYHRDVWQSTQIGTETKPTMT